MDVSIVIVNWNTCELLRDCLNSIHDQTLGGRFDVFVVDNASRDASVAMVRDEFPSVRLIANAENRGFAAANNQGIAQSCGRYVLLLNPDTVIMDAAIDRCIDFADRDTTLGVVGCQVLTDERTVQRTGFAFPSPLNLFLVLSGLSRAFPRSHLFSWPDLGWWDRDSERDLDVVSGMFMLVRREAIEQVGLMDESYFVYAEEADWCYRFRKAGWRCVFTPTARILHLDGGGKSSGQVSVRMFVQMQKSLLIYFRKNIGRQAWLAGKAIFVTSNVGRALCWSLFGRLKRDHSFGHKSAAAIAALRFHLLGVEPS